MALGLWDKTAWIFLRYYKNGKCQLLLTLLTYYLIQSILNTILFLTYYINMLSYSVVFIKEINLLHLHH